MGQEKQKTHVTETPDTSHIKNIDVTHEQSDVQISGIAKFIVGLLILTIGTHIALWGLFVLFQRTASTQEQESHRSPIAMSGEERLPPEPRLQGAPGFAANLERAKPEEQEQPKQQSGFVTPKDPMWEIHALREQWNHVLEHGPTDANGQRFGMPIEQAKEEALRQLSAKKEAGGRPQTAESRKQ
jgi:hypothetical protein